MNHCLKFILHAERGGISVFAAGIMVAMIGVTALVVDIGLWYLKRRELQIATDMAVLAAAASPADANARADVLMQQNGFDAANVERVEPGYYCVSSSPGQRFTLEEPGHCDAGLPVKANAVRLTTHADAPLYFAKAFLPANTGMLRINANAIAMRADAAALRAGSGLLSFNSSDAPLLNAMFASLTGGGAVNLTAAHYNGLVGADIAAVPFLKALAVKGGLEAGTYDQLLAARFSVDDLLEAAAGALGSSGNAASAAMAISGLQLLEGRIPAARTVRLGDLLDLGIWRHASVGGAAAINAGLNAMQLATAVLQLANGDNAAAISQAIAVPGGLATATIDAVAIERPQSAYFIFGPEGMSVHTAQVRLAVSLTLLSDLAHPVPFYVEAGSSDAELSEIDCSGGAGDPLVRVTAVTAAAQVYLGKIAPAAAIRNFQTPVTIAPAWLLDLTILGIRIGVGFKAHAAIGQGSGNFVFGNPGPNGTIGAAPDPGTPASLSAGNMASSLSGSLLSSLLGGGIVTNPLNLTGIVTNLLKPIIDGLVASTVTPLLNLLDPTLDRLLAALGLRLGRMDVWVPGVRCGVAVLVK